MFKKSSRKKSIHVMLVYTGGCNGCDIEVLNAVFSPYYDVEQYRVMLTFNPREADILLVSGPVTKRTVDQLTAIYSKMTEPKAVIAVGSCAIVGGVYLHVYGELGPSDQIAGPLAKVLPCEISAKGCPPTPEEVISAVVNALPKIVEAK